VHPVARFLLPLLENHDRSQVESFCYSDAMPDEMTGRVQAQADVWRDIRRLNDVQFTDVVRQDGIDILVDLCAHANGGYRMLVFARKPAPVQVTYLAYCGTTGLDTIDCRITDP